MSRTVDQSENVGIPRRTDFYIGKYSRWGYVWHKKCYGCVVVYYSMPHNDQWLHM